jgi:hypothetical protein
MVVIFVQQGYALLQMSCSLREMTGGTRCVTGLRDSRTRIQSWMVYTIQSDSGKAGLFLGRIR